MNQFQMAIAVMAACDIGRPRDAAGRPRHYTPEELDALAEFGWPWSGVGGRLAARLAAIRPSMPRLKNRRRDLIPVPASDATAPV
jgi:hypothetical protein